MPGKYDYRPTNYPWTNGMLNAANHCILYASISCASLFFSGCAAEFHESVSEVFGINKSDYVTGVQTPGDRARILLDRARNADADMSPRQRATIARDLAQNFHASENPADRRRLLNVLGRYGGPELLPVLRKASTDEDKFVRIEACYHWPVVDSGEASLALRALMTDDPDPDVRIAAAESLGNVDHPNALGALSGALDSRDPALRRTARESLEVSTGRDYGDDYGQWQRFVESRTGQPPGEQAVADRRESPLY